MEKFHKNKRDKKKEKKQYGDSDDEGHKKKRKRIRNRDNKFKNKKDNENNNEDNKSSGKLKYYIDEKGRKRYDFSGNANENKRDQNKHANINLSLNEEKKKLIFPPADERTFLKPRDESEIIDVEKIKGMVLQTAKVDTTLNSKNKKELDEKISALGVFVPFENKDAHRGDVFYCKTCDCVLKDNTAYIEHLNGKKHNRMLGMNMKVEKVSLDRVKQKLLNMKRKPDIQTVTEEDLEKRLEELERQAEEERLQRKNKKNNNNE